MEEYDTFNRNSKLSDIGSSWAIVYTCF
jgi:hypothetical protein